MAVRHLVECLTLNKASKMEDITAKNSRFVPQILLSNYFEVPSVKNSTGEGFQWNGDLIATSSQFQSSMVQFASNSESIGSNNIAPYSATKSALSDLVEPLEDLHHLAAINNVEKMQMLAITDLLGEVSTPYTSTYESLDEPGRRYLV